MDLGLMLSPAQKQLAEANPETYRWVRLHLAGVAPEVIERRLRDCLRRHEALRLRYQRPVGATGLRQGVTEAEAVRLEWRHAADTSEGDADGWLGEARALCQARQPDLLAWLRGDQLLLAVPAYSLDLRSLEQLRSDLLGQAAAPDAESMQYSDYVEWIGDLQRDEDAEQGAQFWRNLALHEVPGLRLVERYGMASGARACVQQALEPSVPAALQEVAQREGVAVEPLVLAAWGTLLARLNGQRHGQFGLLHDPRDDYEELQGAYGVFEQALPMDLQVSEPASWVSVGRQLARQKDNAILWQEYLGQAQLLPEWRASYQAGLRVRTPSRMQMLVPLSFDTPLELQMEVTLDAQGRGSLALVYDTGLYRRAQMQRLLRRYAHWLGQLLNAPRVPLDELSALLPEEAQAPPMPAGQDRDLDIVATFRAQARAHPERPALRDGDRLLSYAELDALSDRVAGSLREAGVGHDDLVALYLPRGAHMLVAMLACFKAGAAYLPLDPAQPPLRLAGILDDARPVVLLHLDDLPPDGPVPAMAWSRASTGPALRSDPGSAPEHLAYVLYTSGTSGKPKGVQIEQRQLRHYVTQVTRALDLPEAGHYGLVSSLLADLGNTVLYPAWLQGGCVHLLSQASVTDAQAFADELRRHPLDVLKIVPSHLEALIGEQPAEAVLPRQVLVLGGEPIGEALLERLASSANGCRLYNHYGPTETTVGVLWRALASDSEGGTPDTALNRVLGNNRIYLLDERRRPVPSGQAGELCIAGTSVGRGYVGGLGEAAFGVEPVGGGRLYRTGDRALRQADGALRLLGRSDQQVKIRGFRLELAEVEQALLGQPGVRQAAVLLDGDRLLAFVVADAGPAATPQCLRSELARQLPDYMLPADLVVLTSLPLNSNGKLDRQALLTRARQRLQRTRVAPLGELETAVLEIWCRVLGVEELGVTDNFFAVGGHSLAAIKVVALIREQLGINPPTNLLFERQTVRDLVRSLARAEPAGGGWTVLNQAPDDAPALLLVHGAQGHLQAYRPLLEGLGDECAVYGLAAFADGWVDTPLETLLERYVQSIPRHLKQRPLTLLGWSLAARLALLLVPYLQAHGFAVNGLAVLDHDPQRGLAGEGDEGGQLLADVAFYCRSQARPMGESLRERLAVRLTGCDYAEGVTRLLDDAEVRAHLSWDAADTELRERLSQYRAIKTRLYAQPLPVVDVPVWLWRGNAHGDLRGQWQALSAQPVREWALDVGHHAILSEPRLIEGLVPLLLETSAQGVPTP